MDRASRRLRKEKSMGLICFGAGVFIGNYVLVHMSF